RGVRPRSGLFDDVASREHMPVRYEHTGAAIQSRSAFFVGYGADPAVGSDRGIRDLDSVIFSGDSLLKLEPSGIVFCFAIRERGHRGSVVLQCGVLLPLFGARSR